MEQPGGKIDNINLHMGNGNSDVAIFSIIIKCCLGKEHCWVAAINKTAARNVYRSRQQVSHSQQHKVVHGMTWS